jgi:hypothetical protein
MMHANRLGTVRAGRAGSVLLTAALAFVACAGSGSTTPSPVTTPAPTCPPGVATFAIFRDPMTQPPAGEVGVPTTIGSITVPVRDGILGATIQLVPGNPPTGLFYGGTFVATGASSLTAPIPKLLPNTTYNAFTAGVPCGPDYDLGQFTTGAT